MANSFKFPESTLVALRKNGLQKRASAMDSRVPTLYEHLLGYEPIRIQEQDNKASELPSPPILNPHTGFMVNELAFETIAEDAPKA